MAVFREEGKWPNSSERLTKFCFSRAAGKGSKVQDFITTLHAIFDSPVFKVGTKFSS